MSLALFSGCDLVAEAPQKGAQRKGPDLGGAVRVDMTQVPDASTQRLDLAQAPDAAIQRFDLSQGELDQAGSPMPPGDPTHFVTTWKTDVSDPGDATIKIVAGGKGFYFDVDWDGDGVFDQTDTTASVVHTYPKPGTYTVRIRGSFPSFVVSAQGAERSPERLRETRKLQSVDQWGAIRWESMYTAFSEAENLRIYATDKPDLSRVTDMRWMFRRMPLFNDPIEHWDTSQVETMEGMFEGASAFNQPLGAWNTSKVTTFRNMFAGARAFNQPLESWNTASVTDMTSMFAGAKAFNQPLGGWNTAKVTSIGAMFTEAEAFNQPLEGWDTSNIVYMADAFRRASSFDQPLGGWDLSEVGNLEGMLVQAKLSTAHYDETLTGWSSQPLKMGLRLDAYTLTYCNAKAARDTLLGTYGWMITGDKQQCP